MISVVIPALNAQAALPRCFDSLIGATVRGLVKEVVVADGGSTDDTLTIADAAGCHVVGAGTDRARGDWLLFLLPETALEAGWENEAESLMASATLERPCAASFRFALDDFSGAARRRETLAAWRSWAFALPYAEQGLLMPRRFYQKLGGHRAVAMEDADLVRRIGRSRLVPLRSRAINKPAPRAPRRSALIAALHALRVPVSVVAKIG
jgi:glycosyltransferase involved in cell wall biosynthesis